MHVFSGCIKLKKVKWYLRVLKLDIQVQLLISVEKS